MACRTEPASPLTITDALGRPFTVRAAPERIVSLVPSLSEALFAFGLGERVAGVTRFCVEPREAAYACRLLDCKMIIPMHYATFPVLTGTPQALRQETAAIEGLQILEMKPGETLK